MAYLVHVVSANGLRNADGFFGKSDPYVRVSFSGTKYNTHVVKNNLNPVWQSMFLVVPPPTSDGTITFTVMDSDRGVIVDGSDDFLGACTVALPRSPPLDWMSNTITLTGTKAKGSLTVKIRGYVDSEITIKAATALRNADGIFSLSDPYAIVTGLSSPSKRLLTWPL
jgi:Ca2+-dependent lipid-binding protein